MFADDIARELNRKAYLEAQHKDLQSKLAKLANGANFMRYVIHERGLQDWADEPRKRMEKILYDDNDKLIVS